MNLMQKINNELYNRRIVVDLDDTLSKTTTRDFNKAEPNLNVIHKVNYLYDEGWEVIILTARGQLSCKGNVNEADKKYRNQIESWLKKHSVKYHVLSFNKILAAYYIDDKGIQPDAFVDLHIEVIKQGWSGALVERRGNLIYKTNKGILQESKWYDIARLYNIPIPTVHSLIGDTLCLEYIPHFFKKDISTPHCIELIQSIIKVPYQSASFNTYIEKLKSHFLYNGKYWELEEELNNRAFIFNACTSFCHGDFSLENILQTYNKQSVLIDPIYDPNQYSSWLLDVSKMMHSLRKHNSPNLFDFESCIRSSGIVPSCVTHKDMLLLEITQWIRTLKYIKEIQIKYKFEKTIDHLISQYYDTQNTPA